MKPLSQWSGSQRLTGIVTILYLGTAYYHFKGGRNALGVMFAGYSMANTALVYLEGL